MKSWILLACLASACSGNPAAPTPVVPVPVTPAPPVTPTATLTGHVTATNGGQPLGGLAGTFSGQAVTTDGAGIFEYSGRPATALLTLTGASILSRSVVVNATGARDVAIDAITLGGGFDPAFYRQLVRNTFDAPATAEPLHRWTRTPAIYLKTVDEAGAPLTEATLTLIENTIRDAVPRWTSGALGVPTIERGTGTREGQSGWITVKFPAPGDPTHCGHALIAADGGWIELETHGNGAGCSVPGSFIAPRTIRHELGHALGFFHTDTPSDLMWGGIWAASAADAQPSARERYHAALAYRRPVGNVEPDADPSSVVTLAPLKVY